MTTLSRILGAVSGSRNAVAELCPSTPGVSRAADELCLSQEMYPHMRRGCLGTRRSDLQCRVSNGANSDRSSLPFRRQALSWCQLFGINRTSEPDPSPPSCHLYSPLSCLSLVAGRVHNSIWELYLMRGRGMGCPILPGGTRNGSARGPGWLFVWGSGVVYGQAADSGAAAGRSRPAQGGIVLLVPSYNKSAAFSGDSCPDRGEVGHSSWETSLEPEETPGEPGRDGGQ